MINDSDIKDSDIYFLESDFYSNNKKIINQLCDQVIPDELNKIDVPIYINNFILEFKNLKDKDIMVLQKELFGDNKVSMRYRSLISAKIQELKYFINIMYSSLNNLSYNEHLIKDKKSLKEFIISHFNGDFKKLSKFNGI